MNIYNLRVGDLLFNKEPQPGASKDASTVTGLIYHMTPKYVYYAICASKRTGGPAFITKGHRVKKSKIFQSIQDGNISISYSNGTSRRRKINL
tara:strand:- start:60 stop:338 length:279 start_codon:yes stop_codon:yes gene_type:complete